MLVIRGDVERLRRERMNSFLIHCSLVEQKYRVNMFDALPLPFDDELKTESEMSESEVDRTMREYNDAQKYWAENDPFKK